MYYIIIIIIIIHIIIYYYIYYTINVDYSHLFLLRILFHPEVNEGPEEYELGAGGEDQQNCLNKTVFPVRPESVPLHLLKQEEELSEILKTMRIRQESQLR